VQRADEWKEENNKLENYPRNKLARQNIPTTDYTGYFISTSGTSKHGCATTKTDITESSISICRESPQVFCVLDAVTYLQVSPVGGSRDETRRREGIRKRYVLEFTKTDICRYTKSGHIEHP
jgi:hypothetical protein